MERTYAARYEELYRRHWWWRAREEVVLAEIRRLGLPRGNILDVGCGNALFFDALAHFGDVWGIEADRELVGDHDASSRIHVGVLDGSYRPGRRYTLILMLDVLEHMDHPLSALESASELLEPSGWLLITVPALEWLWTSHDDYNQHRTRFTRPRLVTLVEEAGCAVETCRYFFHWTVLGKLCQRLQESVARSRPPPPSVPARWLNKLLLDATRLEHMFLGPLRLPLGSSLVLTARRRDADRPCIPDRGGEER